MVENYWIYKIWYWPQDKEVRNKMRGKMVKGKRNYHDLDHLAGTWPQHDVDVFKSNIESLEKIDEEIWEAALEKSEDVLKNKKKSGKADPPNPF